MKSNHHLLLERLLWEAGEFSRDKKAFFRLKNLMEPLLRCTGVKIKLSNEGPITGKVLHMFQQIVQQISESIKDLDVTQMATAIKSIEKSEVNYNTLIQNLGGPESHQDIVNIAEETLAEIYEGLKQITQLVQVKINVISHHQGLIYLEKN